MYLRFQPFKQDLPFRELGRLLLAAAVVEAVRNIIHDRRMFELEAADAKLWM